MEIWRDIVGEEFAAPGGDADAVDGVVPAWVVRPATIDEVAAVVRAGRPLVAAGLGGHLDLGGRPARLDLLLRLDRLGRVADHQAADMTVTVEAGCPLAVLDATLAAAGQWLPLDPPRFARTTVGGLVAANLSGPLRASQGTARDLLLGVRIVAAGGALVAGGGKVVKNVAGYDLPKLHVGALGTLGVIVEATFKVRPRPEAEEALVLAAPTAAAAAEHALAVRDVLDPLWLEAGTVDDAFGAAVGIGGTAPELAAARGAIEAVARARRTEVRRLADGAAARRRLGGFDVEPGTAVLRASVLPSDVPGVMSRLQAIAGEPPLLAHVANGIVRVRVHASLVARAVAALRPELESRGGALVVERADPAVKAAVEVWGHPGEGVRLMHGIKQALDPAGIFAPGRYVEGI